MASSGEGKDWYPTNGNAPLWLNFAMWVLREKFILQLLSAGFMIVLVGAILGRIDSPMLDAFKAIGDILERQQTTLTEIKHETIRTREVNERMARYLQKLDKE